jgi:foldase protein PrsA
VASVDGHVITRFSVISELEKQGGKDALELLINKQLVNKAASDMNIVITDSDIDPDIKRYEDQFSANGGTLDESLAVQGMTRQDLRDQIEIQKKVEKILGDKVNVTDEEIAQYMKDNSITPEAGKEQEAKEQIKEGLKQEKLSEHSNQLLADLRAKAKVNTFIKY